MSLISAVAARLTTSNAHVRLKVVDTNTSAKASELLAAHKADLAVVRGDTGGLEDARSVLLLTHGVVLLMAPSTVSGDSLGDLRNTTIGVIGGTINRPLVDALKQVYPFDRAKVIFQDVSIADGATALSSDGSTPFLLSFPLPRRTWPRSDSSFSRSTQKDWLRN
ncbi:hypothetical protein ACF1BQ_046390 [Bradyrhizobium sp. RDT10]